MISFFKTPHCVIELNKITQSDVDFAALFLKKHTKNIKSVTIKQLKNRFPTSEPKKMLVTNKQMCNKFFKMLSRMMSKQDQISSFSLVDVNILSVEVCSMLAEGLGKCACLHKVTVSNCNLDMFKLAALAKGLKTASVKSLDLSNNHLEEDSMDIITSLVAFHYKERDGQK